MSKLTEKQKAFADYYIESLNATDSYSKAYQKDNRNTCQVEGCKLLRNPKVKNYIDEVMESRSENRIASAEEIMQILTDIARGVSEEEVVTFSQLGEELRTIKRPSFKDRMKASELLGKRHRMWVEKIEADVNQSVTIIDDIGDDIE